jgi:hypothetical protein
MPGDGEPMMSWHSLPESERNAWRLVGADEVSAEALRRRAPIPGPRLPKPPPSPIPPCPAWRFEVHTRYNCHRSDPHPADYGTLAEGHYWVAVEP